MALLYVDFENGNDNYGGTSFSPVSGTDGRISGTTFSSSSGQFLTSVTSLFNTFPVQYISIFNGTSYVTYNVDVVLSNTTLQISAISGGSALANQSVDRQYYIGGRWKTFNTGATAARIQPGDQINVMASPDPTSIGNATWTDSLLASTTNIASSTNTTPITITSTNHGNSTGDTVVITGHTVNTNANGTWEITVTGANTFTLNGSTGNGVGAATGTVRNRNNAVVRLASPLTQNIASCGNRGQGRAAWTTADAVNVAVTQNTTDFKEGDCSDSIAIGANFTTGKVAYFPTGSLNLSGYQQVSFWIKQTAGTVAVANDISLVLCSDTAGNTPVHTINIESLVVLNTWMIITNDFAVNLNSNIQSIALYVNVDRAAQTFLLSNIIACKASSANNSLNLASLLSTATAYGSAPWLCIQSINGNRVMLDGPPNSTPITPPRGFSLNGSGSMTTTTYKRETVKIPIANTTNGLVLNEAGTSALPIFIYGGLDRSSMSSYVSNGGDQNETYLDGRISNGTALTSNRAYITLYGFSFYRFNVGIEGGSFSGYSVNNISHCTTAIQGSASTNMNFAGSFAYNNTTVYGTTGPFNNFSFNNAASNSSFIPALRNNNTYTNSSLINNTANINMGNAPQSNNRFIGMNTFDTVPFFSSAGYGLNNYIMSSSLYSVDSISGDVYLYNTSLSAPTEVPMATAFANGRIYSYNHDNTPNNHVIFTDGGRISSNTSIRNTNSGFSWALSPTSTNRSSTYPLYLKLATVFVSGNTPVTVKAWMRRSNINLTMGLRIPWSDNYYLGTNFGIPINYTYGAATAFMTANADTWEQVSLTFTPAGDVVIDIYADAYGGTTYTGYVDDLSITQ